MSEETTSAELVELPKNSYRLRCIKCEKGKSREKGTPMLIQEFEIFNSKPITMNGQTVDINGVKINYWQPYTDKNIAIFNAQRLAFGLRALKVDELTTFNEQDYLGAEGAAMCMTTTKEQRNDVTGETIINPNTGRPMVSYRREILQFCPRT